MAQCGTRGRGDGSDAIAVIFKRGLPAATERNVAESCSRAMRRGGSRRTRPTRLRRRTTAYLIGSRSLRPSVG